MHDLLVLDASPHTQSEALTGVGKGTGKPQLVLSEVCLFFLGVNFWNELDAGLVGSMIDLSAVDGQERATSSTGGLRPQ